MRERLHDRDVQFRANVGLIDDAKAAALADGKTFAEFMRNAVQDATARSVERRRPPALHTHIEAGSVARFLSSVAGRQAIVSAMRDAGRGGELPQ